MSPGGYDSIRLIEQTPDNLIYRARRSLDGLPVILKQSARIDRPNLLANLYAEAELVRRMPADRVARIIDLHESEDGVTLVCEDFGASNLAIYCHQFEYSFEQACDIAIALCEALHAMHTAGVSHRQINPRHVLYNPETGQLKLTDLSRASPYNSATSAIWAGSELSIPDPRHLCYLAPEQTGRVNRTVDFRADFYSLGATLYELFTGHPPFDSSDPLELVHAHIAREPPPMRNARFHLPAALCDLVLRLLEKLAENRPPSAGAILEQLRSILINLNSVGSTPLRATAGNQLVTSALRLPEGLFGRDRELDRLRSKIREVSTGGSVYLILAGEAGVGKYSLAQSLRDSLPENRGQFIAIQPAMGQGTPLGAAIELLDRLLIALLSSEDAEACLSQLRLQLASDCDFLVRWLPPLERIFGHGALVSQPPRDLERLAAGLEVFVRAACQHLGPVVLVIEDLFRIDADSATLLRQLLKLPMIPSLMLVCTLDDEPSPAGGATFALQQWRELQHVEWLRIEPLQQEQIERLLAQLFGTSDIEQLAQAIYDKCGGSPHYVQEFITSIHRKRLLWHEPGSGWRWNLAAVAAEATAPNVASFLAGAMGQLPTTCIQTLRQASCFTRGFYIEWLAGLLDLDPEATADLLQPALMAGYLVSTPGTIVPPTVSQRWFQFSHANLQRLCYHALPEDERLATHRRIGDILLADPDTGLNLRIFELVDQLNASAQQLPASERQRLADLNLRAGQRARANDWLLTAYKYFRAGIVQLQNNLETSNELAYLLHLEAMETASLSKDLQELRIVGRDGLHLATTSHQRLQLHELLLAASLRLGDTETAWTELSEILSELPRPPRQRRWKAPPTHESADSPSAGGQRSGSLLRALQQLCELICFGNVQRIDRRWRKLLVAQLENAGDTESDLIHGLLSLQRSTSRSKQPQDGVRRLPISHHQRLLDRALLAPRRQTLRQLADLPALDAAPGRRDSDETAALTLSLIDCLHEFLAGGITTSLRQRLLALNPTKEGGERPHVQARVALLLRALDLLQAGRDPASVDELLPAVDPLASNPELQALAHALLHYIHLLGGNLTAACEVAQQAQRLAHHFSGTALEHWFQLNVAFGWQRSRLRQSVEPADVQNEVLARTHFRWPVSPERRLLWLAIQAELRGRTKLSIQHYRQAMQTAEESGCVVDYCLAASWLGELHERLGDKTLAAYYFDRARQGRQSWGSIASLARTDALVPGIQPTRQLPEPALPGSLNLSQFLDLGSLFKVNQAVSTSPVIEEVQRHLMGVILESAAAHRAALIIRDDGRLMCEAVTHLTADGPVLQAVKRPLDSCEDLPLAILRYVDRTREDIVINDVGANQSFSRDPYLSQGRARSLLCMAVASGTSDGLIYLENNTTIDGFSPSRIGILKLLASQAIVAIQNARLYHQLDESRRRYLSLYENAFEGLFETTADGRLLSANTAATRLLGFESTVEILAVHGESLMGLFANQAEGEHFRERLAGDGHVIGFETELKRKDGSLRRVALSARLVQGDHEARFIEGSLIDLTERDRRIKAEVARRKAEAEATARSAFLANMSHEIRTPMNAILGYTRLALETNPSEQQRGYLQTIQRSGMHLLLVVNDVLDLSKIDAGRLELRRTEFSLAAVLEDLRQMFGGMAEQKGLALNLPTPAELPGHTLFGDPARLRQILINLIGNALKFTQHGSVSLAISFDYPTAAGIHLVFAVTDTGIGIEPARLNSIFDKYFSGEVEGSGVDELTSASTGLGLAITRRLVDLMRGTIQASSTPGLGSRFVFEILLGAGHGSPGVTTTTPLPAAATFLAGLRVLLVEDNPISRQLTIELLQLRGVDVCAVENGISALQTLERQPFDLVLLDIRLPDLDGHQVLARIRAQPEWAPLPVVCLSAGVLQAEIDHAERSGFNAFVGKPVDFDELADVMARLTGRDTSPTLRAPDLATSLGASISPMDQQRALALHNDDPLLLQRFLRQFLSHYANSADTMVQLLAEGRLEEAERLAHNVGSVAGSFAADAMRQAARNLEYQLRSASQSGLETLVDAFRTQLSRLVLDIEGKNVQPA